MFEYFFALHIQIIPFTHFPMVCDRGGNMTCNGYNVGTDIARTYHYRSKCVKAKDKCNDKALDITMWKYNTQLINATLNELEIN